MLPPQQLDEIRRQTEAVLSEAARTRALALDALARSEALLRRMHRIASRPRCHEGIHERPHAEG